MSDPILDEGVYDFAPDSSPPLQRTVQPQSVLDPDAPVILSYRVAKDDKPPPLETETIRNLYLPLGLLIGGMFVQLLAGIIWTHQVTATLEELAVDLTLGTAVMLAAMLLAAKLRNINLGKIQIVALKLAAISIAPSAVVEFLAPITRFIFIGGIVGLVIEFASFFALLGALFDLDESDTWYCVWTMFFTRIAFYLIIQHLLQE